MMGETCSGRRPLRQGPPGRSRFASRKGSVCC